MKTGIFLLLAAAATLAACGGQQPSNQVAGNSTQNAATPDAKALPTADVMAAGRNLYMDNCAACHKEDGKGGKITIEGKSINPEDLTSAKIKAFPDDRIYRFIYNGLEDEGMPAFKDQLSEAEIREVVRYVRAEIQKMPLAEPTKRVGGVD